MCSYHITQRTPHQGPSQTLGAEMIFFIIALLYHFHDELTKPHDSLNSPMKALTPVEPLCYKKPNFSIEKQANPTESA